MSMDLLTTALLDLASELPDLPGPLMVGGGFGLYLRQRHLEEDPRIDTLIPGELWPPARATEDVDLLLPTEVIVSLTHMRAIRAALDRLAYAPRVEHFQFVKSTPRGEIRIDLLTCDVPREHAENVQIKTPRVRPVGDVALHAYITKEAVGLGLAPFELTLTGSLSAGGEASVLIHTPNPFTYLLMKLHALRDRFDDDQRNIASRHALDVYRITAMLNREEFDLVSHLAREHGDHPAVRTASAVVERFFPDDRGSGAISVLRAAEQSGLRRRDVRTGEFVSALSDMFRR